MKNKQRIRNKFYDFVLWIIKITLCTLLLMLGNYIINPPETIWVGIIKVIVAIIFFWIWEHVELYIRFRIVMYRMKRDGLLDGDPDR